MDKTNLRTIKQVLTERPFLTERQLRRWIYSRRVASYKAGGHVLLDLAELDRDIEASHRPADPSAA